LRWRDPAIVLGIPVSRVETSPFLVGCGVQRSARQRGTCRRLVMLLFWKRHDHQGITVGDLGWNAVSLTWTLQNAEARRLSVMFEMQIQQTRSPPFSPARGW